MSASLHRLGSRAVTRRMPIGGGGKALSEGETEGAPPPPQTERLEPTTVAVPRKGGAAWDIGPYRLLERIGVGGMGEVWLAEQRAPVQRSVAVKLIKVGMDTGQVLARFESERQALALMDHPAIARIFDAGTTPDGRPYFVMEHVSGIPITEHCNRHRVDTKKRLQLFVQVCEGVQHAHQKAVIHRDLKPSNVLVSLRDGLAIPKIIDFGLAKALAGRLTDRTLHTELGALVGTPEYMSPEQAERSGQDVDTRTDVYSLGAILYELLTGALPFDSQKLRDAGFFGIPEILRNEEPPTPSRRLSRLSQDESVVVAQQSGMEASTLRRHLEGDLDWITMKALEKDRARRYGSAAELAQDIQRHLADEPVLAGPPTAGYRMQKFVRRHRIAVAAAACVGLALALGIVGTTTGLVRARRAEVAARREAETADRVAGFLSNMLGGVDPHRMGMVLIQDLRKRAAASGIEQRYGDELSALSGTDTARGLLDAEILARAAAAIDTEIADDPLIAARLRHTLARVYQGLGMPDAAEPHAVRALQAREQLLGASHPDTLRSLDLVGSIRYRQGRYSEADSFHRRTLEARRRVLGAEDRETLLSMNLLAFDLRAEGKYDEAEELYRRTLELHRKVLGPEDQQTLSVMNDLGFLELTRKRFPEAERLHREALDIRTRRLGPEHRDTLWSVYNLGWALLEQGHLDEASRLFERCLDARLRVLGADHPDTLWAKHMLAETRIRQGRLAEADQLNREVIEGRRRVLGPTHPDVAYSTDLSGHIAYAQGRLGAAREIFEEILASRRKTLGDDHIETFRALYDLRDVCVVGGWLDEIRRLDVEMLPGLRKAAQGTDASVPSLVGCAFALLDYGRAEQVAAEEALRYAEQAVRISEPPQPDALAALALAHHTLGHASLAIETEKRAIASVGTTDPLLRAYLESQLARYSASR